MVMFLLMPQTGIEPVREYKSRRILSPVRLPVPPRRHKHDNHVQWMEVDSNHRSNMQQIYSLSPLATRESIHILRKFSQQFKIISYFSKKASLFLNFLPRFTFIAFPFKLICKMLSARNIKCTFRSA